MSVKCIRWCISGNVLLCQTLLLSASHKHTLGIKRIIPLLNLEGKNSTNYAKNVETIKMPRIASECLWDICPVGFV